MCLPSHVISQHDNKVESVMQGGVFHGGTMDGESDSLSMTGSSEMSIDS